MLAIDTIKLFINSIDDRSQSKSKGGEASLLLCSKQMNIQDAAINFDDVLVILSAIRSGCALIERGPILPD